MLLDPFSFFLFLLLFLLEDKQEASVGEFDKWHLCHYLDPLIAVFFYVCPLFVPLLLRFSLYYVFVLFLVFCRLLELILIE